MEGDIAKGLRNEAIGIVQKVLKKKKNPKHNMKISIDHLQKASAEWLTPDKLGLQKRADILECYYGVIPALFELNENELAGLLLANFGKFGREEFEKVLKMSVKRLTGDSDNTIEIGKAYDIIANNLKKHEVPDTGEWVSGVRDKHITNVRKTKSLREKMAYFG